MEPLTTEEKILVAARKVFVMKGMEGARMQEIASEAGINKALLHYYYRSKDQLFEAVFYSIFGEFVPLMASNFMGDDPIIVKLERVVETYDHFLRENPYLPQFIVREIYRNPENLARFIEQMGVDIGKIKRALESELVSNMEMKIDFRHLLVNVIGMTILPYLTAPMMKQLLFGGNQQEFDGFLSERKKVIISVIQSSMVKRTNSTN